MIVDVIKLFQIMTMYINQFVYPSGNHNFAVLSLEPDTMHSSIKSPTVTLRTSFECPGMEHRNL
jgi:hypothetical protein